jgi:CopG family transcriptional regulator/antitoxin EndoAI
MLAKIERKRVNVSLPVTVLNMLDELAPNHRRSQFIAEAVMNYAAEVKARELAERLKAGYLARAERDRQIAEEWYPLEQEAYEEYVLSREEQDDETG